ncbi:MAG TPA: transaldolase family protein, partial [Bdellovibrionota bacterium]|nr:transaldolase family protein [Bdellovibrionota bacterium]
EKTIALGAEFWNDSCSPKELAEAVALGATGATSNPVIVGQVVKADPGTWNPLIDSITREHRSATDEEIAWKLIDEIARHSAAILEPVYRSTSGDRGYLSVQVNPKYYRDADRMFEHGRHLASLAPNIAIKAPTTPAGIEAMERLTAEGISVNATVSFTLSQALAVATAIERGLERAEEAGHKTVRPHVTLMVGRLDDHLQRVMAKEQVVTDPADLNWAGIAVVRKAWSIFRQREFRSKLLVAAFRHHLHWSELVGQDVVFSMPYAYWKQFEASGMEPMARIRETVPADRLERLERFFPDFVKAYDENGLPPAAFAGFGPTVHTLNQFVGATQDLYSLVRERMLAAGA